jgi:hypothetical protein
MAAGAVAERVGHRSVIVVQVLEVCNQRNSQYTTVSAANKKDTTNLRAWSLQSQ